MKIPENGLILIIYKDKKYLKEAAPGKSFHGKGGIIEYSSLFGKTYGITIGEYKIFEPTMEDIIMFGFRRETQIVYPKDAVYINFKLNIRQGSRILELGSGSGAMTFMLSLATGEGGTVVSLEREERHHRNTKKNLGKFALWDNVEFHHMDIYDYYEGGFDAAFIDVREPWLYLDKVASLVKESGMVGMIVPTANQLSEILKKMEKGFGDIEVIEILHRKYKTISERVRPEDRMIAHTGYLAFARKLEYKETL